VHKRGTGGKNSFVNCERMALKVLAGEGEGPPRWLFRGRGVGRKAERNALLDTRTSDVVIEGGT